MCGSAGCVDPETATGSFTLDVSDAPYTGHLTIGLTHYAWATITPTVQLDIAF